MPHIDSPSSDQALTHALRALWEDQDSLTGHSLKELYTHILPLAFVLSLLADRVVIQLRGKEISAKEAPVVALILYLMARANAISLRRSRENRN